MDLKNLPPCLIEAAGILRREWYSHMLPDSAEVLGFTHYRQAFAIATGTAVSGLEFNARLKRASEGL